MADETDFNLDELDEAKRSAEGEGGDMGEDPPTHVPDRPRSASDLEAVYDIPVQVSAVLGKSHMQVNQLLKLGRGAVVELDRKVGEAIDIYVNNRLVARGEVVVVEERLGVTMTEIIKTDRS
ncbi:flagellar motor switch protein FliN [Rhodospira trueperi]|uniref:Flagellar motor switch protein FliN n=1 Tax=Rhodospira trueperi TaxID=69960 RepID=A0A1G7B2Y7_9PROT|nr:flagellar motor switch protein FliN [Rhodospira trueperi]SDE21484.1 flagellar motor switch protein FliN/FliY [Rhodospira trueperi]